jgi:ankyrin repeat protein
VRVLAHAGADLNLPENRGWTALMIAASRGCVESIEALLGELFDQQREV